MKVNWRLAGYKLFKTIDINSLSHTTLFSNVFEIQSSLGIQNLDYPLFFPGKACVVISTVNKPILFYTCILCRQVMTIYVQGNKYYCCKKLHCISSTGIYQWAIKIWWDIVMLVRLMSLSFVKWLRRRTAKLKTYAYSLELQHFYIQV